MVLNCVILVNFLSGHIVTKQFFSLYNLCIIVYSNLKIYYSVLKLSKLFSIHMTCICTHQHFSCGISPGSRDFSRVEGLLHFIPHLNVLHKIFCITKNEKEKKNRTSKHKKMKQTMRAQSNRNKCGRREYPSNSERRKSEPQQCFGYEQSPTHSLKCWKKKFWIGTKAQRVTSVLFSKKLIILIF